MPVSVCHLWFCMGPPVQTDPSVYSSGSVFSTEAPFAQQATQLQANGNSNGYNFNFSFIVIYLSVSSLENSVCPINVHVLCCPIKIALFQLFLCLVNRSIFYFCWQAYCRVIHADYLAVVMKGCHSASTNIPKKLTADVFNNHFLPLA